MRLRRLRGFYARPPGLLDVPEVRLRGSRSQAGQRRGASNIRLHFVATNPFEKCGFYCRELRLLLQNPG